MSLTLPIQLSPRGKINKQLYKLKKYSLTGNTRNRKNIEKLAKCVAEIHLHNIKRDDFEIYNVQWVAEQACKIEDVKLKAEIISTLKAMLQIESYNSSLKKMKFLAWDISRADWHQDYQFGKAGNCAWDLACIINCVNDSQFSEIFLTSYLRHGGEKPTLTALYANLYYAKVFEAVASRSFENIAGITKEIIDDTTFNTDIISYDTLLKLNITGY